nr:cytochrome c [Alloyangia pacifica]
MAETSQIAEGEALYAETCAACHGANLEGQPNWRRPGPDGRLPAPPHDASGHTWHHPDDVLFRITKLGTAAVVGNGYESNMPGFGDQLTNAQIEAIFTYIKSTWPEELRAHQAEISAPPG